MFVPCETAHHHEHDHQRVLPHSWALCEVCHSLHGLGPAGTTQQFCTGAVPHTRHCVGADDVTWWTDLVPLHCHMRADDESQESQEVDLLLGGRSCVWRSWGDQQTSHEALVFLVLILSLGCGLQLPSRVDHSLAGEFGGCRQSEGAETLLLS